MPEVQITRELMISLAIQLGYRLEMEETENEFIQRLFRPDNSCAIEARQEKIVDTDES